MSGATVALHGRLGKASTMRTTANGKPMAFASMCVTLPDRTQGDDGGEFGWWVNLVAFGRTAEELGRHAQGDLLAVHGALQHSTWQPKDGGPPREQWQCVAQSIVSARSVRTAPRRREAA